MNSKEETLRAVAEDLASASRGLERVSRDLSSGFGKSAEGEEPPAEEGGGDEDLGDFDEGTTGEEGGDEDLGDLDDLDDLGGEGGDFGGGAGGDMGGFGGGEMGGDMAAEGDPAPGTDELKGEVDGLKDEIKGIQRTIVDIAEVLKRIRDPLGDPASGNDAMHSV